MDTARIFGGGWTMPDQPFINIPMCALCDKPIALETAKADENGKPVHEDCYIKRLLSDQYDPPGPQHVE